MNWSADIRKWPRNYLAENFKIETKDDVIPVFEELLARDIPDVSGLEKWLSDGSELQAALSEDVCWRQIKMTCDTDNPDLEKHFTDFIVHIDPYVKPLVHRLNQKFIQSEYIDQLGPEYQVFIRGIQNAIELYREENIALESEIQLLAQQYGVISGRMTIEEGGQEYTLQQAAKFLQQSDPVLRERIYRKISERRYEDRDTLQELFDKLLTLRHQVALNAGFANYRDYMFKSLGRFDYGVEECEAFHQGVKEYILPLVEQLYERKKKALDLETIHPYDIDAVPEGQKPLEPFRNGKELIEKAIRVFETLNPFFAQCIRKMDEMNHLDLDSRRGKAPGGYNCPLAETGVPFIFMNAAGTADDVITMMHEAGHAFHSFLSHSLKLNGFKEYPMEMAELASMSMELFTFEKWDVFYEEESDLLRAQKEQLERVLTIFPWIATIDQFQHWLYTHPEHTVEERTRAWMDILHAFYPRNIDISGLEKYREILWQKQLHLYEVPFYYIEYGIAQLGALAMWKQYLTDPEKTIENYLFALSRGYTLNLRELYQTAGIEFNFSSGNMKALS